MSHNIKFPQKLCLALSCFLPLYVVFGVKNLMAAYNAFRYVENSKLFEGQNDIFFFNAALVLVWLTLMILSMIGIYCFMRVLEGKENANSSRIVLIKAENITADYYFSYFSLFVLSFFSIDPTQKMDIGIYIFLKLLIICVYIVNDMYFINPVLNLLGYRSFSITYQYDTGQKNDICLECRAFSRERLNKCKDQTFDVVLSKLDFTACIRPKKETN